MPPKFVTVTLQPGVTHAIISRGGAKLSMKATKNYDISYDDWRKIGLAARESTIKFVAFGTGAKATDGTDLTINSTTLPNFPGTSTPRKLGAVVQGFGADAYKLVKLVDAVNAAAGDAATWADIAANKVTVDRVGGTAIAGLPLAGVFVAAVTAGRFGWIQIDGVAPQATASADVVAGDNVDVHPTVDGSLRGAELDEIQTITITGGPAGGTFTLSFGGQTTAGIAFNANAATVQAALELLSTIGAGNVLGGGGALPGTPVTIEFRGTLANKGAALMTANGAGLTGGTSPAVAVTRTQAGGLQPQKVVGTALTDVSGGKVELGMRSTSGRTRHVRGRQFYSEV